jgi:spoIIIJ-associated protein
MEKDEKNSSKKEFKGRNLEDAISLAEHVLKLPRSKLNYEIVAEKTKLFGIKSKEIVIRAWPKETEEEHPAVKFLSQILAKFPLDINFHLQKRNEMVYLIFEGPDKHLLLRKEGSLLFSLQHILNKVSPEKIQTDCNFYRKRKEQELKEHAKQIAQHVQESGENEVLDPMNPYERRIIHVTINQFPGISTKSLGEGFLKKVNIFPIKNEAK